MNYIMKKVVCLLNPAMYIAIIVLIILPLFNQNNNKKVITQQIARSRNKEERFLMLELTKKFIGKECLIYTLNSQLIGTIMEVSDGAILVENKNIVEAVNFDFIVRIREYPVRKSGKKKSLILD